MLRAFLACLWAVLLCSPIFAAAPVSGNGLQRLIAAYPDHLAAAGANLLVWKDGAQMIYDDGKSKTFDETLEHADLQDQMSLPYPPGRTAPDPLPLDFDPGRFRHTPFFMKMYGNSAAEVQSRLATVIWLPKSANLPVRITTVNNVHKHLDAISREIDALPQALKACAMKLAGSFNWRAVRGQNQLSAHSFGIAIDLAVDCANFWRWDLPTLRYRNRIPLEIVDIFEKHGFIWGGKWYHYDTMHFEYRPELLPPSATLP